MFLYYIYIKYIHINGHFPVLCSSQKASCIFKALGLRRSQNRAFKPEYERILKYVWGTFCIAFIFAFEYALRRFR
jgi:hypothetical protein